MILPFFIAAVVYVIRRFVAGDRRMGVAAGWAVGMSVVGALAILVETDVPQDRTEVASLSFRLALLVPLAGALWVAIYSGMLLGDQQNGYWVKTGGRTREAIMWGGMAVMGLLAVAWAGCRHDFFLLNPALAGQAALARGLARLTYSLNEEFFYRGCVQALLVLWLARFRGGRWWAVVIATVVFTAQHDAPLPQLVWFVFPAGVVFGVLFIRFGLWTAAATHTAVNLVMTFVLPQLL